MKVKEKKWIRFRILLVTAVFLCGFGGIVARAYQFQVVKRDRLRAMARSGYTGIVKLPPERGTIYDRQGHELALSVEVSSIYAHPRRIRDKQKAAVKLARVLGASRRRIYRLLNMDKPFVWIQRKIDPAKAKKIRELDLPGIGITAEKRRYYPGRELAAQLLGFVGADNQGLEGLEAKYDAILKGPGCELVQMRDALGRPFFIRRRSSGGRELHNLVLTIDKEIQYKAEKALVAAVRRSRAKGGQCVVVNPDTGEILAMAVVPRYNPNIFSKYPAERWRNRTVTDCFEPGSTLKAFLLAAILEEGVLFPNSRLYCEEGTYKIADRIIHDTHKYGTLTVTDIIALSSNIGAIKMGQQLGYNLFCKYLTKFGFGSKTNIGLLGERSGFIRAPKKAKPVDQATAFFGQGISVTTLQLAMAMAAIANGGTLMRPYVVKEITESAGHVVRANSPRRVRRVISPKTARMVTAILEKVVSKKGTGPEAAIEGYQVAGKTGTAQKVDPKTRRYSNSKYVASFVGFAPAHDPKLVIASVIDEPKGIPYGGVVAAPVFRDVGLWALNYLKVAPEITVASNRSKQRYEGTDTSWGRVEKVGRPSLPLTKKHGRIGRLPDFRGLGIRDVLVEARALGIRVILQGTGLAYKQSPPPGMSLSQVRKIKVHFRPPGSSS